MNLLAKIKAKLTTILKTKKQQVKLAAYSLVGLFVVAVSFQNCGSGFQASSLEEGLSIQSSESGNTRRTIDGGTTSGSTGGSTAGSNSSSANSCVAGNIGWNGSTVNGVTASCSASYGTIQIGGSVTVSDNTAPGTGSAIVRCSNNGVVSVDAATSSCVNSTGSTGGSSGTSGGTTGSTTGGTSGGTSGGTTSGGTTGGTTSGGTTGGNACQLASDIILTDSSGATCRFRGASSYPDNNSGRGMSYTAAGDASKDVKPGVGRVCLKCVNNVIQLSTNPDVDCAAYTNDRRQYCEPSSCVVNSNYGWSKCQANNQAMVIPYGEERTFSNVSDLANSGSVKVKCERVGVNQEVTVKEQSCDIKPVFGFHSLKVEYGSAATPATIGYQSGFKVKESDKKTFLAVLQGGQYVPSSKEATYEDITGSAPISSDSGYNIEVSKVTLTECNQANAADCRFKEIDPNKLSFESVSGSDGVTVRPNSMFVCFDLGQSVAAKRGLINCDSLGTSIFYITDKDQSLFPSGTMAKRGTMVIANSRTFAKGIVNIRVSINSATPGVPADYVGRYSEFAVEILNRPDIRLIPNQKLFTDYGASLITINAVGEEGSLNGNATFETKSCSAVASTGATIPGAFDSASTGSPNRYRLDQNALKALPQGTELTVTCSAKLYNSAETASTVYREIKP